MICRRIDKSQVEILLDARDVSELGGDAERLLDGSYHSQLRLLCLLSRSRRQTGFSFARRSLIVELFGLPDGCGLRVCCIGEQSRPRRLRLCEQRSVYAFEGAEPLLQCLQQLRAYRAALLPCALYCYRERLLLLLRERQGLHLALAHLLQEYACRIWLRPEWLFEHARLLSPDALVGTDCFFDGA